MKWEITGGSAFPVIKVNLEDGEGIKAESGAMVAKSAGVELEGKMDGGFGKSFARLFAGESFFMQSIKATQGAGWVMLATAMPGGIAHVEIEGDGMIVQKNGYLAATHDVEVSTKAQSLSRGLFSGEGFFVLKLTGRGTAFLSTYGSIEIVDIPAGERVTINNGNLVAWDMNMQYTVTKGAKSWFSSFTSGAGFVCDFQGPGRVYIQTRNPYAFGAWAMPYLPIPRRGN